MLLGHDEAWREWRAASSSPRMHHGWILTGIEGIGKGQFARAAAAKLVAEPGIAQPAPNIHPDIIIPEHPPENKEETKKRDDGQDYRRKRSIPIDSIRAMQQRLTTRPTLGRRRVVIIDPADDLEKAAVNALLKSLEEPPQGTFFLLVTHRFGRLLPTIRSRCRIMRFSPLDDAAMDAVLRADAPEADAQARAAAITAAHGSPGAALRFIGENLAPLHSMMQRILAEGDAAMMLRGALSDEIGLRPSRERLAATLEMARAVLAGQLPHSEREQQTRVIEANAALTKLAAQVPTYNFDPGLIAMEIGGLLAGAAATRDVA